jgi:hypothetical protein
MNVNGTKIECSGGAVYSARWYEFRIVPGDYQGRLVKSENSKNDMPNLQAYELLLPKGRAWSCTVTGIFE